MIHTENSSRTMQAIELYALGLTAEQIALALSITLDQLVQETSKYITF